MVSSTETAEPQYVVVGKELSAAVAKTLALLEEIFELAAAQSKVEREHLPELLQGKTEFTLYE